MEEHRSFKPPYKTNALCTESSPNPLFLQIPKEKECFNRLSSLPITSNGWIHIGPVCERGGLSPHTREAWDICHKISTSGMFTEQIGTWWRCPTFLSAAVIKYPDQKQLRGRKGLFQLICCYWSFLREGRADFQSQAYLGFYTVWPLTKELTSQPRS